MTKPFDFSKDILANVSLSPEQREAWDAAREAANVEQSLLNAVNSPAQALLGHRNLLLS